ncbi:MAG TPA: DUF4185 domain-containing protein [Bryobacteraceae bacterium]|nr:DUF4185 domain-containing protein [Bryobacteraceae bacterium]
MFLEGTNDIAKGATAASVIAGDQQIINSAHAAGLKIIGATIIPRGGDGAWTNSMEQQRVALNTWIRLQANFDGIIDFDILLRGPVNAGNGAVTIQSQWSCFDGIHPNSAGYAAMGAFIDLSLFPTVAGQNVQYVPESTTPLIQLIGENSQIFSNGTYFTAFTPSRTLSTSGVLGTDLAFPVTLPDKTVFLFGDTIGAYQSGSQYVQSAGVGPYGADDSIGFIPNVDLSQCHYIGDVNQQLQQGNAAPNVGFGGCPSLHFYANPSHPSNQHIFEAIQISGLLPGEGEGPFRVPTAALAYNDRLYMFYVTMYQSNANPHFSLQSILARSDQSPESWSDTNPPTFTRLYTVSSHPVVADPTNPPPQAGDTGEFMFNPPVVMDSAKIASLGLTQGLPAALQGVQNVVFVFGSSYQYNQSNLYLAAFSLSDIEAGTSKWFYYKGNNQWSSQETDSAPLLTTGGSMGNHSVKWNDALHRFVLMYNNAGAQTQFSATPWGPWSDPVTIFSGNDYWGSRLIHHSGQDPIVRSLIPLVDSSGNPVDISNTVAGAPYSPNLLDQFTQNSDGSVTLYYTLSTWNPYEVFLMKSTFTLGCNYFLNLGGQGFPAQGGTGTITVTTAPGCPWTVENLPAWVMLTSAPSGAGKSTVTFQVFPNSGGDLSGMFAIAGQSFTVEQEAGSIVGLNFIGSMAHLAAEENWTTAFTLVNKSAATTTARLSLFGDAIDPSGDGPLTLPVVFPQQPPASGPLLAPTFDRTLASNALLLVDTAGAQIPPVLVGSAQLTATSAVDGFAIFHQIVTTQEAVVPMETRNASSYLLAFDNTNGLVLGVALENISAADAVIPVVIRDENGVVISAPGTSISVPGNGHFSFVLSDPANGFPVTASIRGTIEFDTPAGGRISVLGIRFTPPNNALTTIPALANVGTGGGSIAHLASGGDGWQTTFVLVNTGTSTAQFTLSFFADQTGALLSLPLAFPQPSGGAPTVASSVTQNLAAGATRVIVSSGAANLFTGSAQLTTAGHISGFVIFRHNNQEAVVPLESRNAGAYIIAFDNTNGTATGIAVNAVSTGQVNIPVTVRDDAGATIATDTITLSANGHYAFTLVTDRYTATANIRGTIEFDTPAGAQIGALGIRIPAVAAHTYTTLPALAK